MALLHQHKRRARSKKRKILRLSNAYDPIFSGLQSSVIGIPPIAASQNTYEWPRRETADLGDSNQGKSQFRLESAAAWLTQCRTVVNGNP